MSAAKEIVKRYLVKKAEQEAAKAAERASLKAVATPEQLVKLELEEANAAAEAASERRAKKFATEEEERLAEQEWLEKRAHSNALMARQMESEIGQVRAKVITNESRPRFEAPAPSKAQVEHAERLRAVDEIENAAEKEKELRKFDPKAVQAADEKTKVGGYAPALAVPGMATSGFTNPTEILKHGYDKFEKVRQTVVDKIVDLTGGHVAHNPHVPQYAKDTYNKAADALVSNATDPLNYVGGAGAADAALGAASTGYDLYNSGTSNKVKSTPVQKSNVQVVNWNK